MTVQKAMACDFVSSMADIAAAARARIKERMMLIDLAVRYVEECYPRTMKLLLDGHSNGEPMDGSGCIACRNNVRAIRMIFEILARGEPLSSRRAVPGDL